MEPPILSVIIPCRGHARELRHCLEALHRQTGSPPYEVIVIDSAGDPAVAAAASAFPGVRLISRPSGLYPGEARNEGAAAARADALVFIDADCVPEPHWLATAFAALRAPVKVVAGAVLDAVPSGPIAGADNLLQFADFSPHRPDGPIANIATCNFGITRAAFGELGGFVRGLPLSEDGLFSMAAAARWPGGIRFVSGMRVRHAGRSTLAAFWKHQWEFGFARGSVGSRLGRPVYQRWGRWLVFIIPVMGMRLAHVLRRTVQWHPAGLFRLGALLPVLLAGLAVWAVGFRRGCRVAAARASDTPRVSYRAVPR